MAASAAASPSEGKGEKKMATLDQPPLRVLVTGAAGQIAYSLLSLIGNGLVFGSDQSIILHLLDIAPALEKLKGVKMEIEDCAYPLIKECIITTDLKEACMEVNAAFLVGGMPRSGDMSRKDLLSRNGPIFVAQGKALSDFANRSCKILVIANPANTNALIALNNAPKLSGKNFSALTRLDQNRATRNFANLLSCNPSDLRRIIIWGNHSSTMFADFKFAQGHRLKTSILHPEALLEPACREFLSIDVAKRGGEVLKTRGLSSALSAAQAASDHMRDWFFGTKPDDFVSMAVLSDGSYGISKGLVFSFPCTCTAGEYKIKSDIEIDEYTTTRLAATEIELLTEREDAAEFFPTTSASSAHPP